ncbi:MAG: MFS transporter, partial [Planctomycetes bacterium]|nr:MFS transporter [Planctomycetota bacterium]
MGTNTTSEAEAGAGRGEAAPPRRYYGTYMVPIAVITMICTLPGQTIVVSQFNGAIREALNLSISQISLAYLIGTSIAALPLTLVGRAADRFGLRIVLGVVAAAFSGALVLLGQARGLVTLTIGFALVRFLGQGSLGMLASHTLAMWFERRLGVMESVKHVGFSVGALVLPIATVGLIHGVGWRRAFAILGAGVALVLLPIVATVFRNRPEDVGQDLDGGPAPDSPARDSPARDSPARDSPARDSPARDSPA